MIKEGRELRGGEEGVYVAVAAMREIGRRD
jgi:hypothetical protein